MRHEMKQPNGAYVTIDLFRKEPRMGEGYCPRCLKSKENCTCLEDSFKQFPFSAITSNDKEESPTKFYANNEN